MILKLVVSEKLVSMKREKRKGDECNTFCTVNDDNLGVGWSGTGGCVLSLISAFSQEVKCRTVGGAYITSVLRG